MSNDIKQNRVLEILLTVTEATDSVAITGIRFRHDGFGGAAFIPAIIPGPSASAAAGGHITAMGEQLPPFTHVKIISTHV